MKLLTIHAMSDDMTQEDMQCLFSRALGAPHRETRYQCPDNALFCSHQQRADAADRAVVMEVGNDLDAGGEPPEPVRRIVNLLWDTTTVVTPDVAVDIDETLDHPEGLSVYSRQHIREFLKRNQGRRLFVTYK